MCPLFLHRYDNLLTKYNNSKQMMNLLCYFLRMHFFFNSSFIVRDKKISSVDTMSLPCHFQRLYTNLIHVVNNVIFCNDYFLMYLT